MFPKKLFFVFFFFILIALYVTFLPNKSFACSQRGDSCDITNSQPCCNTNDVCQGGRGGGRCGDGSVGAGCRVDSDCLSGYFCVNNPNCTVGGNCNAKVCSTSSSDIPTNTPIPPNPCPSQEGACTSIDTALGNIDVSGPGSFIKSLFALLLSLSGGTALLLIIISGYRIMVAQGDPEKLKGAREMLTSAIIGLLFVIFSVTILQILGVDILHIPGFGK